MEYIRVEGVTIGSEGRKEGKEGKERIGKE